MKILFPVLGIEQGQVVSMHVGPSVNPYLDAFTSLLQLYKDQIGEEHGMELQFLEPSGRREFASLHFALPSTCKLYKLPILLRNTLANILSP